MFNQDEGISQLLLERRFGIPAKLLWPYFAHAVHLENWWGPHGSMPQIKSFNFLPGGKLHYYLPDDSNGIWCVINYLQIVPERLIQFTASFSNANGDTVEAPFCAEWPKEILYEFQIESQNSASVLRLQSRPLHLEELYERFYNDSLNELRAGYCTIFNQLEEYIHRLSN